MISDRVVFVLGAGCSVPFGFPTGQQLRDKILEISKSDVIDHVGKSCPNILEELGVKDDALVRLQSNLRDSQINSIDRFLSLPKNREFLDIGKIAIASCLIPYEEHKKVLAPKCDNGENNWYQLLWNEIVNIESFEEFDNNLSIYFLTFNYDRSLEHFLTTVLKNTLTPTVDEIDQFLCKRIVHVHGQLGAYRLRGGSSNGRFYRTKLNVNNIRTAAEGIKVIHESSTFSDKPRVNELIESCNRLVFLGFGYSDANVRKLFSGVSRAPAKIIGSSMGLMKQEIDSARKKVAKALKTEESRIEITSDSDLRTCEYLRSHFEFA